MRASRPSARSPVRPSARTAASSASRRSTRWRSEPAAVLRGLANAGRPRSCCSRLIRSKSTTGMNTSPRTSSSGGTGRPDADFSTARDGGDEAGVVRDVLAHPAVAAGRQRAQAPVDVHRVHGQAVDLQLAQQVRHRPQARLDPVEPRLQLLGVEGIVEGVEALQVLHRLEHLRPLAAHGLRRRLPADQVREGLLEFHQLGVQHVVLGVRQRRRVLLVVRHASGVDRVDQLRPAGAGRPGRGRDGGGVRCH